MQDTTDLMEKQLISYGIEVGLLISGFFGSLLLVSKNASQRIGSTMASLLAGTACANYLTPVVINFVPESARSQGKYAVAFMMGFMGLKGLELIIEKVVKLEKRRASEKKEEEKKTVRPKRVSDSSKSKRRKR
jgi:hypothetical protein